MVRLFDIGGIAQCFWGATKRQPALQAYQATLLRVHTEGARPQP